MHDSYIVRVYRHEKDNPRLLVGTVERVGAKGKTAFTNVDELWEIMNTGEGRKLKKRNMKAGEQEGNIDIKVKE